MEDREGCILPTLTRRCHDCGGVQLLDTAAEADGGATTGPCGRCGSSNVDHAVSGLEVGVGINVSGGVSMVLDDAALRRRLDSRVKALKRAMAKLSEPWQEGLHGDDVLLKYFELQSFYIQTQGVAYSLVGREHQGSNLTTRRIKRELVSGDAVLEIAWDLANVFKHGSPLDDLLSGNEPVVLRARAEYDVNRSCGYFFCDVEHAGETYEAVALASSVYQQWETLLLREQFLQEPVQ